MVTRQSLSWTYRWTGPTLGLVRRNRRRRWTWTQPAGRPAIPGGTAGRPAPSSRCPPGPAPTRWSWWCLPSAGRPSGGARPAPLALVAARTARAGHERADGRGHDVGHCAGGDAPVPRLAAALALAAGPANAGAR